MERKGNSKSVGGLNDMIQEAIKQGPVDKPYVCQYCGKGYIKESTLASHLCEQKRRFMQKSEKGVVLGFEAYNKFYKFTQGKDNKNYDDFCKSPYYLAFVKFGRYLHSIEPVNTSAFMDWVIKKNKKLDHWCREDIYSEFLTHWIKVENSKDALERSIIRMGEWADDTGAPVNHFFLYANVNQIVSMIYNGRISPWTIYCSRSGQEMLTKLNDEQITLIWPMIDSDFWAHKLKVHPGDTAWCESILKEAGF